MKSHELDRIKETLSDDDSPEEGDIMIQDTYRAAGVYQYGKRIIPIGNSAIDYPVDGLYARIAEHMKKTQFWPNVWWVTDHGLWLDKDFIAYAAKPANC